MQSTIWCICLIFVFYNMDVTHGYAEWKFGVEIPTSYVLEQVKGTIQLLEKTKVIPLNVPVCHQVTSVRVYVNNPLSTPTVSYDEDERAVTVAYTQPQVSLSDYDILVKGQPLIGCQPEVDQCVNCNLKIDLDYY